MRRVTLQPGYTLNDVLDLLASRQFVYAECYTITPLEGPIMRFTDAQNDVSVVAVDDVNRYIYYSKQLIITGLRSRSSIGLSVDEQDATVAYGDDQLFQEWMSWPVALKLGRLDGATVTRDRAVSAGWDQPWMGVYRKFSGLVSTLDSVGRSSAVIKVKSALEKLDIQMPRDLYNPTCKNVWGDTRCGVIQGDFAVTGTIGPGATRTILPWTGANPAYGIGKIHINNNDDVTRIRTVALATSSELVLVYPLDFTPEIGLEFTAYPGCDRSFTRCGDFHADPEEHFGGTPFIPVAETAA